MGNCGYCIAAKDETEELPFLHSAATTPVDSSSFIQLDPKRKNVLKRTFYFFIVFQDSK